MKMTVSNIGGAGVAVGLIALVVIAAPWLLFWSVGVLFGVEIHLTFWTWLAAVVFLGLVRGGGK